MRLTDVLSRRRPAPSPNQPVTGWLVAGGAIAQLSDPSARFDDHFAVLNGPWATSPDNRFIVAGEIQLTNRETVCDKLQLPASETDLSLVAHLWSQNQTRALESLHGAFAFAVWDKEQKVLKLVRDRIGVETLYYTTSNSTWYAGTRALIASKSNNELDLIAVRDYLSCAFVPGPRTMRRDVREVQPGTIVQLPGQQTTVYWRVEERAAKQQLTIDDYGLRLRRLLDEAVRASLPEREPVGVFLSGGLDSSCVAALTTRLHNAPVHSYSIHFGAECPNELGFSSLVAKHCETEHHIIEITPDEMWNLLPETMAHLDDPIGDPLTVPNLILGTAAKVDVNTILNGEGGDPCFGGPKNQPMLLSRIYDDVATNDQLESSLVTSYLASFQKCAADLPFLLQPEVWNEVSRETSVFAEAFKANGNYVNNLMFINTRFKGADHILTKVSNLTRAVGLKGRSPLFDDRLVQLSLEMPAEYKLDGAREKAVLKLAVADLLPNLILERPKSGMMVPVQRWFREQWRTRATSLLLSRNARTRRLFNSETVSNWLNYRGDTWSRYGVKLWLLVSLELWLHANNID
jgi:asparagine synthase (glutamine-hydrolysing)